MDAAIKSRHDDSDFNTPIKRSDLALNIDFLQYDLGLIKEDAERVAQAIKNYQAAILPPFTKALMEYVKENKYTFCTPGHLGGTAFQRSAIGALFYDFFGANIFKADVSISIPELGSLLDHTGPHREAENFAAETFNADRTFFVINGTSTANKVVGMYAAGDGDTILVDRNCHKSITHFMMMTNVTPVYLKPTRNAYGILGGIPLHEFAAKAITKTNAPVYAVITNSTYDGLLYNIKNIAQKLKNVKHLHFDSAWMPYTNFHPIYKNKFGMSLTPKPDQVIFETQSTHKLLAAFSQASMLHAKGSYDEAVLNECYMMHTSTSPFYPLVASCEISAAMMRGKRGELLMSKTLQRAYAFRKEVKRLHNSATDWFYDVWQPDNIKNIACWELKPKEKWHGFKDQEADHIFLDPLKITLLMPGLKDAKFEKFGIPASIVSMYLDQHGIVVEKTGPYSMLFLFSIGITQAKAMKLLSVLNHFKEVFDNNLLVKEVLPALHADHPEFYSSMRIQELAAKIHRMMQQHNLPDMMYRAFDTLPKMVMTPHQAYQHLLRGNTKIVRLRDMIGKTAAEMILPYPPGVPLIMPGECVTKEAKEALEYLMLLEDIGRALPGFEADIHGVSVDSAGYFTVKVIKI
jgi:lysine decarboxylase